MDDEEKVFSESFNRLAELIDQHVDEYRNMLLDDLRNVRSYVPADIIRVYNEHCEREHWRITRKGRWLFYLRRLIPWRRKPRPQPQDKTDEEWEEMLGVGKQPAEDGN